MSDAISQIAPNIYCIAVAYSNFYLCVDDVEGLTLIDAGVPNRGHHLFSFLGKLGYQPQDLKHILLTHSDMDHVGSAADIQAKSGARVYASGETAVHIQNATSPKHLPPLVEFIVSYLLKPYQPIAESVITIVQDGDVLPMMGGIHVLATPGHTPDHHSFYCPSAGVLFTGDALNTNRNRIQLTPKVITADMETAVSSAIRLLEIAPAILACSHGVPKSDHSMDTLMDIFNKLRKQQAKAG